MAVAISLSAMPSLAPARRVSAKASASRPLAAKRAASFGAAAPLRAETRAVARARSSLVVRAVDVNVDALLEKGQAVWEGIENKPVVVGYSVGLLLGLYFVESLIHLPVLNLVVGFPLELLGVCSAGALGLRYLKQGVDPMADVKDVVSTLESTLPGLKK